MSSQRKTFCLLAALLSTLAFLSVTLAKPDPAQLAAMADAIKYLQQLDKYYSQVARPSTRSDSSFGSPGRSHDLSRVKQALKMLKLQELDRFYSHRARPRFGKRTEVQPEPEDGIDQGTADLSDESKQQLWNHLLKRR